METGSGDDWKDKFDAHAYLDTFYNCAAADNQYRKYMDHIIQSYHDVFNEGELVFFLNFIF